MRFAPLAAVLLAAAAAAPAVRGEEPVREFLDGLRDRGLADFALLELDRLAADPGTPADIKQVLPYERAVTLLQQAQAGAGARAKLDEAAALLERFAENAPDSPLAGDAQFLRAEILQRSAADALGAGDPADLPDETKDRVRRLLDDAGRVYVDARGKLEARLREIGPYVDQADDDARADRSRAEGRLIRSRIEAARTTVLRAKTYAPGDPQRSRLLDEADAPLEDVRKEFRTKVGALPGRVLQGEIRAARVPEDASSLPEDAKTRARQDLAAAGALFDEVYSQQPPADASRAVREAVNNLRGTARRLKFAVLNHPLKADHGTVVTQATEWLTENRTSGEPATAAGILVERGRAYENLDPPELRRALGDYQTAARRSAEVRGTANLAADRVRSELGLSRKEPTNFGEAFEASQTLVRQLAEKQQAVADATDDAAKSEAEADLAAHVEETARLLEAAVNLADARTAPGDLGRTRYLLAYFNVQLGRYYEAAILATDVARNFTPVAPDETDPEKNAAEVEAQRGIPLEAASTAVLAWTKAYQDRPAGTDGSFELARLNEIADFIARRFPESDRASTARLALGRLLLRDGNLPDAAAVFAAVPESDASYAEARLKAGDALWRLFLERSNAEPPAPQDELDDLKTRARAALETGIAATDAKLPADAAAPASYVVGKVTLAQLLNRDGEFAAARDALAAGPHPVTGDDGAIAADGDRPDRGVTSAAFAGLALQQLLRAQIGLKEIGPAMDSMRALESVSDGGNTGAFVALGKQIEEELAALPPGEQREETLAGFEQFLGEIAGLGGQTYGSRLWVAETYAGLAAALPDGAPRAAGFYKKSADALRATLADLTEDGFLPSNVTPEAAARGVKLRLAEVLGGAGEYEPAYAAVSEVLAESPNALNAQTAAADLLADWGEADGDEATLAKALRGDGAAWGWGKVAGQLARQLAGPNRDAFVDDHNAARLRIPQVRKALAETKSGEERKAEFAAGERELLAWVTTTDPADIAPDTLRDAEELYEDLQRGRGVANPEPLPADPGAAAPPALADAGGAPATPAAADDAGAVQEDGDGGPNMALWVGLLALAALATAGAVFAFRPKKKKRARRRTPTKAAAEPKAGGAKPGRKSRGAVRDSLPDVAPVPAAVPKAAAAPTGTGFPDFSNLPKKGATATKTRRTKAAPTAASAAASAGKARRSASSSSSSKTAADGAKRVRRAPSSGTAAKGEAKPAERPRKPRPKPDPSAE